MVRIIGYTDSITDCECCGKTELNGTYCVEVDGVEMYYGSSCVKNIHNVSIEKQRELKKEFNSKVKIEAKFKQLESEHNGSEYSAKKMLKFVETNGLDVLSFMKKYGKLTIDNQYMTAYSIGSTTKIFDK